MGAETTLPRRLCGSAEPTLPAASAAADRKLPRAECPFARPPATMGSRMWSVLRLVLKGSVAGGAVYLVYDQGLLSTGDRSQVALRKCEEVVAPALYQAGQYVSDQTGLKLPQLPALPKVNFHFRDSWDSGILAVMKALSEAPSKACQYSRQGWDYVKERVK